MLPKSNRLRKKKDFDRVFKKGKRISENFLIFQFVGNDLDCNRFGFVISKKVSKKATIRNSLKRKLGGLMEYKIAKKKNGIDGVFLVKPGLETENSVAIKEIVDKIFKKVGLS